MKVATIQRVEIRLGDKEYGNELMLKVATEAIAEARDRKHVHVTIIEHGGWWLQYAFLNDADMVVVGSANDSACYSKRVEEWWAWANAQGFQNSTRIER